MRIAIATLLLLGACYKDDAIKELRRMGRPEPINCAFMDSRGGSVACTDGAGTHWICDQDGCIEWGPR